MKKHKQRPPDPKDIKEKHIMTTTKIDLCSILGYNSNAINDINQEEKNSRIQDAVQRVNHIVFHTTHFMELYLLHLFQTGSPKPDITLDFIGLCMRTVAYMPSKSGRKPNQKTLDTLKVLKSFYIEHYEPLIGPEPQKIDLLHIGDILQYEEIDILKNIKNNIWMHFTDYCKEWVNKEFELKAKLSEIDTCNLTEEQKKLTKRNLSIQMRLVKEDLLSVSGSTYNSDPKYHQWLNENKPRVVSKTIFNEDLLKNHIHYDIKANTLDYLFSFFYVINKLRKYGRNIQCIPLRSSFTPKYITLDTASVIMLMVDKDSIKYRRKVKESRDIIWSTFFNTEHKVFRRKDYNFFSMIKTDGVGASIIFYRSDKNQDKLPKDVESSKESYVDEMRVEDINYVKIVGIDVGKDDLLHCTDGSKFFRYTANQRRLETRKKKYMKINEKHKLETRIDGQSIKEWETVLSLQTKYSTDVEEFKNYLKIKLSLYSNLGEYYYEPLRRKLRWNTYINTQKSEAKMINNFKKKFGSSDDTIIAIGDFDQGSYHMKYKEPTKGKGLRKVLRQAGYQVLLVDEFRTSCKCHNCHCDTEKFHWRENHKPPKKYQKENDTYQKIVQVHGLLRCSSANGCGSLWNRDVNGCLNIRMLAVDALSGRERHKTFQREKQPLIKNSCELNDSL
jgi:transposase